MAVEPAVNLPVKSMHDVTSTQQRAGALVPGAVENAGDSAMTEQV